MLPLKNAWSKRNGVMVDYLGLPAPDDQSALSGIYALVQGPDSVGVADTTLLKKWWGVKFVSGNVNLFSYAGNGSWTLGSVLFVPGAEVTKLALAFDADSQPVVFFITSDGKLWVRQITAGNPETLELGIADSIAANYTRPNNPLNPNGGVAVFYSRNGVGYRRMEEDNYQTEYRIGIEEPALEITGCGLNVNGKFQVGYTHDDIPDTEFVPAAYDVGVWKWVDTGGDTYFTTNQATLATDAVTWDNGDAQLAICCGITDPDWNPTATTRTGFLWEANLSASETPVADTYSAAWIGFGVGLYGSRVVNGVHTALNDVYDIHFEFTCGGETKKYVLLYSVNKQTPWYLMFEDLEAPAVGEYLYPTIEGWRTIDENSYGQISFYNGSLEHITFNFNSYEIATLFPGKFTALNGFDSIGEVEMKVTVTHRSGQYPDLVGYMKFRVNQIA